jgi:pimeloyl-ACP methyl ester carboxylesterase
MIRTWPAALLALLIPAATWAEPVMLPAWPERPVHGPAVAKGAVIWSHGLAPRAEASRSPNPIYLETLAKDGWDVFRVNRKWSEDRVHESAPVLSARAETLRADGYRRVVLAGQSFGAWLSFAAAVRSGHIDAIVATAPAAHGQRGESLNWQLNATNLYDLLESISRTRVMIFFFAGDGYDPGGRAERSNAILETRGFEHVVIDRPEGFQGHGVSDSAGFARSFGPCIAAFIAAVDLPPNFGCSDPPLHLSGLELPLPKDFTIGAPGVTVPALLARYAGAWYGHYSDGREMIFAPVGFGADTVRAVYSFGRTALSSNSGTTNRTGGLADGALVFGEPGRPRLTYRPRDDGRLDATWESIDKSTVLRSVLRRVD